MSHTAHFGRKKKCFYWFPRSRIVGQLHGKGCVPPPLQPRPGSWSVWGVCTTAADSLGPPPLQLRLGSWSVYGMVCVPLQPILQACHPYSPGREVGRCMVGMGCAPLYGHPYSPGGEGGQRMVWCVCTTAADSLGLPPLQPRRGSWSVHGKGCVPPL